MTDHELLDLAAKAAGIKIKSGLLWNPLVDDGDALRLAVKLEITIEYRSTSIGAYVYNHGMAFEICQSNQSLDLYAATRRAIVKLAAEIGQKKITRKKAKK